MKKYLYPRAGGGPPVHTSEFFLQGHWAWGWLWFGLLCRLWLWRFRVRGAFVCPCRWFALDVGFGRSAWRWIRLSSMLLRVRCWFWSFALGVGFGPSRLALACVRPLAFGIGFGRSSCAAGSFRLFLGYAPLVGIRSRNLAEKWGLIFVSLPCSNTAPTIPSVKIGRPAGALESVDLNGPNRHPYPSGRPSRGAS